MTSRPTPPEETDGTLHETGGTHPEEETGAAAFEPPADESGDGTPLEEETGAAAFEPPADSPSEEEVPQYVAAARELGQRGQPGYHLLTALLTVDTAVEDAGPCRMCSFTIEAGQQYVVINLGRRVHYVDCSDQARAAGYLGPIDLIAEAEAEPEKPAEESEPVPDSRIPTETIQEERDRLGRQAQV